MLQHSLIFKLKIKLLKLEGTREAWWIVTNFELDTLTECPISSFQASFSIKI